MDSNLNHTFAVEPYGELKKYNEVLSQGRCRIFYKGLTRNRTYITDEFAEKLLTTLPYTPIKGIYSVDEGDYTDHGSARDEGRIYGIVPAETNLAWEEHLDKDGVKRTYACCDVLYYTGLYKELDSVNGKSLSMELYAPSIKGDWKVIDNESVYVYTEGCFLGLQILGDKVEPAFEGAAFYSLIDSFKQLVEIVEKYNLLKGDNKMDEPVLYRLSDEQKHCKLASMINPVDEDGYRTYNYEIVSVYNDYAVVHDWKEDTYKRVYYSVNEETEEIVIDRYEDCYIIDVSVEEYEALKELKARNNDTYSGIGTYVEDLAQKRNACESELSTAKTKVEECELTIATLTTEKENAATALANLENQVAELNTTLASLNAEKDALLTYKHDKEVAEKKAIISNYVDLLSSEVIDAYTAKIDDYTNETLDMYLTYECKKANPSVFSKNQGQDNAYLAKDNNSLSSIEVILSAYERK